MSTIIVVVSLLWPAAPGLDTFSDAVEEQEVRYRGIEALLAQFEAEAENGSAQNL